MIVKTLNDKLIIDELTDLCDLGALKLPDPKVTAKIAAFLRREFGELTLEDFRRSLYRWVNGDLEIRRPAGGELSAHFLGQILKGNREAMQGRNAIDLNRQASERDVFNPSPEDIDAILANGWENVQKDFKAGICRGYIFISTLYHYGIEKGFVHDNWPEDSIQAALKDIDLAIRRTWKQKTMYHFEQVESYEKIRAAKVVLSWNQ